MTPLESPAHSRAIADLLGVAETAIAGGDPVSFLRALVGAELEAAKHPLRTATAFVRFGIGAASALTSAGYRAMGGTSPGPVAPAKGDRRFADRSFEENPFYFLLEQQHLLAEQLTMDLIDAAQLDPAEDRKARMGAKLLLDTLAPTNTLVGNPAAIRVAVETSGLSLVKGARNMLDDLMNNGGWPSQVDSTPFELGVNTGCTKGKVVYRSDLIEILQYEPQTKQVYEIPLLFCPPWINKFYIMDLAPKKSLIEWAVQHGHTAFAISYRNPDASMRDTSFEDYLFQGPLDALRVVKEITGAEKVNTVSVCLGGTLTAIGLSYMARIEDDSVNSATFLNTLVDFAQPGALGAFTDEATVAGLEKKMAKTGYLDAKDMAHTFDALRANDLIFQYVVNNWLMGKKPPAFDLLAWNKDSTRMPALMHSTYIRSCYLRNEFANGDFKVADEKVDPGASDVQNYVLSAVDDHIVPWTSAYRTTQLLGGPSRFVLSTSGHIAGIVNPPSPKSKHWTNDDLPENPKRWMDEATLNEETWWEDWTRWIGTRAGKKVTAPTGLGSKDHAPMEDAPGTYVRAQA